MPFSKKARKVLSKQEVMEMISRTYGFWDSEKAREIASLIAFLWRTGSRISEALAVKREDVKISNGFLNLTIYPLKQSSKNVFPSTLPFRVYSDEKKNFFNRLIIVQAKATQPKQYLWCFARNTAWEYLTRLKPDIYPHMFRHSRATIMADHGANEVQLKKWFRWAVKSNMPSRYVNFSAIHMRPISELSEDE